MTREKYLSLLGVSKENDNSKSENNGEKISTTCKSVQI